MTKIIVSLLLVLASGFAQASGGFTVFDNVDACKIAVSAGKAQVYTPTTKAPFAGGKGWTKKVVGAGGACLGQAHVLEDGAPKNGKSVFVSEGFAYWQHTSGSFRMNDCSNPYGSHVQLAPVISTGTSQPETATPERGSCTTDDCGNSVTTVINKTIVEKIVEITDICRVNGVEIPMTNGKCVAPSVTAVVPVKVESPVTSTCLNCSGAMKSMATNPVAQSECPDCNPELKITGKVARTDGRCVMAVKDENNIVHFLRFGLQDNNHLSVAVANNDIADVVDRSRSAMVADEKSTVQIPSKDCGLAVKAFSSERALRVTAPKLGFKRCVPIGQVTHLNQKWT